MKKNLIVHIGHGKTGTSYIQSVLALNIELLSSLGITYPDFGRIMTLARSGNVTAGHSNIFSLSSGSSDCEYYPDDLPFDGRDTLLLSGEFLFRSFEKFSFAKFSKLYKNRNVNVQGKPLATRTPMPSGQEPKSPTKYTLNELK